MAMKRIIIFAMLASVALSLSSTGAPSSTADWNLDGTFGILDTTRTDCEFEDFHGHKLDRKALELLMRN